MTRHPARTYVKYALLVLISLAGLLSLQQLWLKAFVSPEQPKAVQGAIDFRGWDFARSSSLVLDGEWDFYPGQWLTGEDLSAGAGEASSLNIPGRWEEAGMDTYGYGTYRLRILLDQPLEEPYALWIHQIQASSEIEINGDVHHTMGRPSPREEEYRPEAVPYTVTYEAGEQKELDLVVRAANFDHGSKTGISYSIRFGSLSSVTSERRYSMAFQLGTMIILLLHTAYAALLFGMNPRNRSLLALILLFVCLAVMVSSDNDALLLEWLPLSYGWAIKIKLLSYLWLAFSMLLLAFEINGRTKPRAFRVYTVLLLLYSAYMLAFPIKSVLVHAIVLFNFFYIVPPCWMFWIFGRMAYKRKKDVGFLLFTVCCILSGVLWGSLVNNGQMNVPFYPVDFIGAIVGFSAYWFKQFFRQSRETVILNDHLLWLNRQKDQFLVSTSSVLRAPLHVMLDTAQSELKTGPRNSLPNEYGAAKDQDLNLLIRIGRRMSRLLDDLTDIASLQEGHVSLKRKPVDFKKVTDNVTDMLHYLTEGRNLSLRTQIELPSETPYVYADEQRLFQIVFNLVHNAIKHTDEGQIIIRAEGLGHGRCRISVTDSGTGMDEETMSRIFTPYEQGNGRSEGGFGLGLSISKRLAELHGSGLEAESRLGEGSTFRFMLPLAARAPEPEIAAISAGPSPAAIKPSSTDVPVRALPRANTRPAPASPLFEGEARILIADDDPVNQQIIAHILAGTPCRITAVMNGAEALKHLYAEPWDLWIVDAMMPHMTGYELIERVRERFDVTELPILLLTSGSTPDQINTAYVQGANDYVTKPVDSLELLHRISALISMKQSVDQSLKMEAAYLQAQIRPHFLFNTINSIVALSEIDPVQMREVTEAFSRYLRFSMEFLNSERSVPVEHEISLVKAYLFIEQVRFGDRLRVEWDIDDSLAFEIPPLTIQPMVENAVSHGLLSRAKGGRLTIGIKRQGEEVLIEIGDNGKGMGDRDQKRLTSPERPATGGIGIWNTHRRLVQRYGQGLHIESRPGEGTTVSFRLPLDREMPVS